MEFVPYYRIQVSRRRRHTLARTYHPSYIPAVCTTLTSRTSSLIWTYDMYTELPREGLFIPHFSHHSSSGGDYEGRARVYVVSCFEQPLVDGSDSERGYKL